MTVLYTCRSSQAAFLIRRIKLPGKWFVCIQGHQYSYWRPIEDFRVFSQLLSLLRNGITVAALH